MKKLSIVIISLVLLIAMISLASAACVVTLNSPNGGEKWSGTQMITWTNNTDGNCSTDTVTSIEYSTDSGSTWLSTGYTADSLVVTAHNWSWNSFSNISPSSTTVKIKITLNNSNNDESDAVFTVDNVFPSISITDDADNSWTNNDTISVTVSAASGIVETKWIVTTTNSCTSANDTQLDAGNSGTPMYADDDSIYQNNYICFRTTNGAGNSNYNISSKIEHLDTTAPTVDAGNDIITNTLPQQISATASDGGSNIASHVWTGSGLTYSDTGIEDPTVTAVTSDGVYTMKLNVTDQVGYSAVDTASFTYDTVAPSVDAGTDKIESSSFTQDATFSDATSGLNNATRNWIKLSGPGIITFTTPSSEDPTISADADGTYVIQVMIQDNAGNNNTDNFTLIWDTTAPTFAVNNGTETGPVQTDIINVTVSDATTSVSNLTYGFSVDGICDASDSYSTSYTNNTDFSIAGDHTDYLCVQAEDEAGNFGYQLVGQLNTDNTNPTVSNMGIGTNPIVVSSVGSVFIMTVDYDSVMNTSINPTITFGTDLSSTLTNCNISWTDSDTASYNCTIVDNDLTALNVDVNVTGAKDLAGNTQDISSTSNILNVDTLTPTVTDVALNFAPILDSNNGDNFLVTVNYSESMNQSVNPTVTFTPAVASTLTPCTKSWIDATHFLYNCTVVDNDVELDNLNITVSGAVDLRGNVQDTYTSVDAFDIDMLVPTATFVSIRSNNVDSSLAKVGDIVTLVFNTSEDISTPTVHIAGQLATINNGPDSSSWNATYIMQSSDVEGGIPFMLNFNDLAGNPGAQVTAVSDASSVTFDKTRPTITVANWFDNNQDGDIDSVVINFSEVVSISDGDSGDGLDSIVISDGTNDYAIDPADYSSTSTNVLVLNFSNNPIMGTGITALSVTYDNSGSNSILDRAGNEIANAATSATYVDSASPIVVDRTTDDLDANGQIDTIFLIFSEVLENPLNLTDVNVIVAGHGVTAYADDTVSDNEIRVNITESGSPDTAATPLVQLVNAGGIKDVASNAVIAETSQTSAVDEAAPVLLQRQTFNSDGSSGNGQIDAIVLTFSENLNSSSLGSFATTVDGYSVSGNLDTNLTDNIIVETLTESGFPDTGVTPNVAITNAGDVVDFAASPNHLLLSSSTPSIDGAEPIVVSKTTEDEDGNGQIDTIYLIFSEVLETPLNLTDVNVTVAAHTVTGYDDDNVSDNEIRVNISESGSPDTAATPLVQLVNAGGIKDVANNTALTSISSAAVDEALPVLLSAVAVNDTTIELQYSEDVTSSWDNPSYWNGTGITSMGTASNTDDATIVNLFVSSLGDTAFNASDLALNLNADASNYVEDLVPNKAANVTGFTVLDGQAPNLTITLSDYDLTVGETAFVTFDFSEVVTNFTNADISADNGNLTTVANQGSGIWTATFTPDTVDDQTNLITVNMTDVFDLVGNAGVGTTSSSNYKIDTIAPVISVPGTITLTTDVNGDNYASIGDTITYTAGSVVAPDGDSWTADLSAYGLSGFASPGDYVVVAGDDDGALVATETVLDNAGNADTGAVNSTVSIDNIAPVISVPGTITLTNDVNGDSYASIGDTINYTAGSVVAPDGDSWTVDLSAYGLSAVAIPGLYIVVAGDDDDTFVATETVSDNADNINTSSITTVGFTDIDNQYPVISVAGTVNLSNDVNGDGIASIGDTITYAAGTESTADTVTWTVNLSQYGLSSAAAPGNYVVIADNDNNVIFNATETVTDDAINSVTGSITTVGFTHIDNVAPIVSMNPKSTSDTTPELTGLVDDNAAVITVSVDGQTLTATNNGDGTWTLADNSLSPLAIGVYNVVVVATDTAKNTGNDTTAGNLNIAEVTYKFYRQITQIPRYTSLISNSELSEVTGWSTWTLDDLINSSEGVISQRLSDSDVNTVYVYDGSSWTTYTTFTWNFDSHNSGFVGYYVFDLKTSATGKYIRHN